MEITMRKFKERLSARYIKAMLAEHGAIELKLRNEVIGRILPPETRTTDMRTLKDSVIFNCSDEELFSTGETWHAEDRLIWHCDLDLVGYGESEALLRCPPVYRGS